MGLYAGIDLHSSNIYLGILDGGNKRIFGKRLPNCIEKIKMALEPFKKEIADIAVESTYNWYWLVDGLMDEGYSVHLANPAAMKQYDGLKYTDDKTDAFWLAQMLALKILPEGYIYPKEERPVRDLLRRRMRYVNHRTSHILSF
jgi:transposase